MLQLRASCTASSCRQSHCNCVTVDAACTQFVFLCSARAKHYCQQLRFCPPSELWYALSCLSYSKGKGDGTHPVLEGCCFAAIVSCHILSDPTADTSYCALYGSLSADCVHPYTMPSPAPFTVYTAIELIAAYHILVPPANPACCFHFESEHVVNCTSCVMLQ